MGEIQYFLFENKDNETVAITVSGCVKKAEALLISEGIKPEIISQELGVEVLFARESSQSEYQNYIYKKIEELKNILPRVKNYEINLLTSILLNTVLLKYKAHLLFVEDQRVLSIDTDNLVDTFLERSDIYLNEHEFFEQEKYQGEEYHEIGEVHKNWSIHPPKRIQGYALALIRALEHFNQAGLSTRPTARNVLEYFRERVRSESSAWPEIAQVHGNELAVASRTIIWTFIEQFRMGLMPLLHGLQGRFALQR